MKILTSELPDILWVEPDIHRDDRGLFFELFNQARFQQAGLDLRFVQDNISHSIGGVLRGLHYQIDQPQGKLVAVLRGRIFDVAVDLRRRSKTFGRWAAADLNAGSHRMIWIPPGFAHGFYTLSDQATVLYKVTEYYAPGKERTLLWNDPQLAIDWPIGNGASVTLSDNDRAGQPLARCDVYEGDQWL